MRSKKDGHKEMARKNSMQVSLGQLLIWNKRSQFEVYMRQIFQNILIQ